MKKCTFAARPLPRWRSTGHVLAIFLATAMAACSAPLSAPVTLDTGAPLQPEGSSAIGRSAETRWQRQAVAAAHPLAAEAGLRMLRAGGGAIDAAIAAQMVLTLVEPQSSGIGGGAFLLHHDGQRVRAYDGRETAPAAAGPDLFLDAEGKPMTFMGAVVGGRSVGVPGVIAMLALAHRDHGRLPWASLFEPAIRLATDGYPVGQRLHTLLAAETALKKDPAASRLFYRADGQPHPVGHVLRNPDLAQVFRLLATQGADGFYSGPVAQAVVAAVSGHPDNPGPMTLGDLAGYRPKVREALCHEHDTPVRRLRLCGFPPPSSGALAIGQILGLLARTPQAGLPLEDGQPSAAALHAYVEAARLAFADRAQYVADPDFLPAPGGRWTRLLAPDYLDRRARVIGPDRAPSVPPGDPGPSPVVWAPMPEQAEYGTSHLSVVDAHGHALAMTTTIEAGFGARLMVRTHPALEGGFLLNNQLTDFSFSPADAQGRPVANRVEPGKRPRSSMSPTLVFDRDSGQLLMSLGSPGGAFIVHFTAKTLLGTWHQGLTPQQAIDLPNFGTTGGPVVLEAARFPAATAQALEQRGHTVQQLPMPSGLQALQRGPGGMWLGGADPRREGVVLGD
ncbi:gamma-glutamyltransferase family protein [Hydrogenophaga sp.]|uniref:gamma-glutamyltransferase family protein n=1 Tax=Hydrogenophaga sp. TaxID=1904254 RepID=UPI002C6AF97F|nr:gamma-glutamyltransferase family protein [Hydrogenophaga sp.]HMP10575.1 gamma-glutamyltransferase family protein [Hydrogenophaga sp.]